MNEESNDQKLKIKLKFKNDLLIDKLLIKI